MGSLTFPGARESFYVPGQVLDPAGGRARAGQSDLIVFDPTDPAHNAVITFRTTTAGVQGSGVIPCSYGGGRPHSVLPWMVPKSRTSAAKDLAVLLESPAGVFKVWRARLADALFRLDPAPLSETEVEPLAGLAAVRREALAAGESVTAHARSQDLVARSRANPRELLVFRATDDDRVDVATTTVGGEVRRLQAASASGDALEDLVLLLADSDGSVLSVVCLVQHADFERGVIRPAAEVTLLRFASPFGSAGAVVRGFHFDATNPRTAEGVLVLAEAGGTRSEVRFVQPFLQSDGTLTARMVRCPLAVEIRAALELASVDPDGDGQADTVSGSPGGGGLLRLDRGFRR